MKANGWIAAALAALALSGCAQTESQQRAGTGALVGAAGGALVGQAIGGNTESTLIGAGAGALLGAVVGSSTAPKNRGEEMCRYREYKTGRIFVAPCDDRYYRGDY
jgi:outer membrane lipoprotein SlyB